MCALKRKSFCFLSLLFLFSSLACFSESLDSSLPVDSSAQSGQSSLDELVNETSQPSSPQINTQLPLEKRQAMMLQAWIEWYNQEMIWRQKVKDSWTKAKNSYEKLDSSRVLQINSRDFEIESLKTELKRARTGEIISGAGGFAAGYIVGRLTK